MLTLQQIKANPEEVVARLAVKGFDGAEPIARVIALDDRRRQLQLENDNKAAELNRIAASIGALMKQGQKEEAAEARARVGALKEAQRIIAEELAQTEKERDELLSADAETIRKLAAHIRAFMEDDCLCVVGNEEKIKEQKDIFGSVEYLTH